MDVEKVDEENVQWGPGLEANLRALMSKKRKAMEVSKSAQDEDFNDKVDYER